MNNQNSKKTYIRILAILFGFFSFFSIVIACLGCFGIIDFLLFESKILTLISGGAAAGLLALIAFGLWHFKSWAKTAVSLSSILVIFAFLVTEIFNFSSIVFAGKTVTPLRTILSTFLQSILSLVSRCGIPILFIIGLRFLEEAFIEGDAQRFFVNNFIQKILVIIASTSILVVFLIFLFTFIESSEAISGIGLAEMLLGTIWRPGAIIGSDEGQFGLVPMVLGSIYSTIGAVIIGVPLSIFAAILLAEIAPPAIREIFRPAIELLAGIPSVIFGLFGMVVLAPLIRHFEIIGNSGFGILNASVILAIMILPTITNVAEDAIRAVPDTYRHASLAMGATHWQTIVNVVLPSARSGIIAAIILGVGRALGETMALIMVIGNSIAIPVPLDDNPLSILFATARTLTGNIAVEINYAAGVHRSALFFTGVLLFLLLLVINRIAHFIMRERQPS